MDVLSLSLSCTVWEVTRSFPSQESEREGKEHRNLTENLPLFLPRGETEREEGRGRRRKGAEVRNENARVRITKAGRVHGKDEERSLRVRRSRGREEE